MDNSKLLSDQGRAFLAMDTDGDGIEKEELAKLADVNKDGKVTKAEMDAMKATYGMSIGMNTMMQGFEQLVEKPMFRCLKGPITRAINSTAINSVFNVPGTEGRDATHEETIKNEAAMWGMEGKDGKKTCVGTYYGAVSYTHLTLPTILLV